ncbi:MAG: TlpA family protein disulfide reductase [Flavobacteriales bacterium]
MGKLNKLIRFLLAFASVNGAFVFVLHAQTNARGELYMNDRLIVPFDLFYQSQAKPELVILNGEERITLVFEGRRSDSLFFNFPYAAGKLVFHEATKRGYWLNLNKAIPVQIPLTLEIKPKTEGVSNKFDAAFEENTDAFTGVFDVTFYEDGEKSTAIGIFDCQGKGVKGTFRTQTGDYRYLSGGVFKNTLKLSCFDGYHAYLFEANIDSSGILHGVFYAGQRYRAEWLGIRNNHAALSPENEISFSIHPLTPLSIDVKSFRGKEITLDKSFFKGRPTVVQLMGSWCPNCLDESLYFNALNSSGRYKPIRFVGVSFENGSSDKEKIKRMKGFSKRVSLNYPLYLGGGASTAEASKVFHQLNGVYSFPTTVFLDKQGRVVEVHSGFDGPATGGHFNQWKEKTQDLLRKLIEEE